MGSAAMMGWDADAQVWRKLVCNAAGKLIIDPSEILEEVPTNNEVGKAPTSNWAFDHKANASAHHPETLVKTSGAYVWNAATNGRDYPNGLSLSFVRTIEGWPNYGTVVTAKGYAVLQDGSVLQIYSPYSPAFGGTQAKIRFGKYDNAGWSAWQDLGLDVAGMIATHTAIAAAHHARYTDAEAVAAVGYNGTKYWSCSGIHFDAVNPDTNQVIKSIVGFLQAGADGISLVAQVLLPHGATVTRVIVNGNAAAAAEAWELQRIKISDRTVIIMADGNINSADLTITSGVIDNSLYSYFIYTSSIDTNDEIWGAVITYTL